MSKDYSKVKYEEDEYISFENDPEKVLIVPEDDYVTQDGEVKIEHEERLSTIKARSQFEMSKHDFEMEEKLLDSLRRGKLK